MQKALSAVRVSASVVREEMVCTLAEPGERVHVSVAERQHGHEPGVDLGDVLLSVSRLAAKAHHGREAGSDEDEKVDVGPLPKLL